MIVVNCGYTSGYRQANEGPSVAPVAPVAPRVESTDLRIPTAPRKPESLPCLLTHWSRRRPMRRWGGLGEIILRDLARSSSRSRDSARSSLRSRGSDPPRQKS
jgi:hypothetical protein